jgi:N-glycosylase/DNA lyase
VLPVRDYDLAATLSSGQAFRWVSRDGGWNGVIGGRWVSLREAADCIVAEAAEPVCDWSWLVEYLQTEVDLRAVVATFPDDEPMRSAVRSCRGLRLLRQEPWECLASFILSSTKQIVQIRQIVALLCERFGEPIPAPAEYGPAFSFPGPARLARLAETELRGCRMGFRAAYLLETARRVADGEIDLPRLCDRPIERARAELMSLPGVGRKVADCVLLFACGFRLAFPVDVWVMRALRQLYFHNRSCAEGRLRRFAETHFGPNAGYAQQYLFHHMRTFRGRDAGSVQKRRLIHRGPG